jgi:hypothetical protein
MPGFDRTGPEGLGPMTGRRMGRCTNYGTYKKGSGKYDEDKLDQDQRESMTENGFGFGSGYGRGRIGRRRRPGGIGRQNRFRNRI